MKSSSKAGGESALRKLRRLAQSKGEGEQCEFCSLALSGQHRHLLEVATRRIICACDPCALRFENVIGRWKLIPRDAQALPGFQMSDEQWESFALPINLAFFFYNTATNKITALYPSPAGPTESLLPLPSWQRLLECNPCLAGMEADVQALLVNRLGAAPEYYLAPIDLCYELVGLIRIHWRGLSGGENVWREIDRFFARLRPGTPPLSAQQPEAAHA